MTLPLEPVSEAGSNQVSETPQGAPAASNVCLMSAARELGPEAEWEALFTLEQKLVVLLHLLRVALQQGLRGSVLAPMLQTRASLQTGLCVGCSL